MFSAALNAAVCFNERRHSTTEGKEEKSLLLDCISTGTAEVPLSTYNNKAMSAPQLFSPNTYNGSIYYSPLYIYSPIRIPDAIINATISSCSIKEFNHFICN